MAEIFDGEDPSGWNVHGEGKVVAHRDGVEIATILMLEGSKCHLTIPRWDGLIRGEHLSDYRQANHGLKENTACDVLFHEKFPDSEGYVDFGEPPNLNMPPQPIEKRTRSRPIEVIL